MKLTSESLKVLYKQLHPENQNLFIDSIDVDQIIKSLKSKLTNTELDLLMKTNLTGVELELIKSYKYFFGSSKVGGWEIFLINTDEEYEDVKNKYVGIIYGTIEAFLKKGCPINPSFKQTLIENFNKDNIYVGDKLLFETFSS
jgi:hypothetical protein